MIVKKLIFILIISLAFLSSAWANFPFKTPANTKLLIVSFINNSCAYCFESLQWLDKINYKYQADGLAVVVVNFLDKATTGSLIPKNTYSFQIYDGNNAKLAKKLQVVVAPTTLLFNSQNEILVYQRGSSKKSILTLQKHIENYFKK